MAETARTIAALAFGIFPAAKIVGNPIQTKRQKIRLDSPCPTPWGKWGHEIEPGHHPPLAPWNTLTAFARFAATTYSTGQARRRIQQFGQARLVRLHNGRHELIGGSAAGGNAAKEWASLFAREIVFPPKRAARQA